MGAAFLIPAAMSLAGSAAQFVNQRNANSRASDAEVNAIQNQQGYRDRANAGVNKVIQDTAASNPNAIANTEQGNFVSNLRRNQAGSAAPGATSAAIPDTTFGAPVSALPPAAGASARYKSDTKSAQDQTQQFGTTLAGEVAKIDAPVQQRMKENQAMQLLGSNLNTIGAESYTKNFVDQLRARQVGQTNPWVGMFNTAMQGGAASLAMNPSIFSSASNGGGYFGNGSIDGNVGRGLPGSTPYAPQAPQLWSVR